MRTSTLLLVMLATTLWVADANAWAAAENARSGPATDTGWTTGRPATFVDVEHFPRGTWDFQLDGTYIHPFQCHRFERLAGGHAGVGYYLFDGLSVNFDVPMYSINQCNSNTFGAGFDLLGRWHFIERGPLTLYADGGAGMIFSSSEVPRCGTHVNFTPQIGLGATWQLNDHTYLFGGARYWHLSNAGMCGRERNPSIDGSVMAYFGVGWRF